MIGELENRPKSVPVTFSFRGSLDIRHRLPDRMGQGVNELVGDIPLRQGFLSPGAARHCPVRRLGELCRAWKVFAFEEREIDLLAHAAKGSGLRATA